MERSWRAWWPAVLAGGLLMGLALGIRHVQGLFMLPLTFERGWTRADFALALALQNLVWGVAQPFAGMVADRFGSRPVLAAGVALYALGLTVVSKAAGVAALFVGAGLLGGVALACTAFGVVYGALSRIVATDQRPAVLGLTGAVGGLGQFLAVPLTEALQRELGAPSALLALGALMLLALPLARRLDDRTAIATLGRTAEPRAGGLRAALREAFAHRGFWLVNLGFLACGFQLAFIATHLPAYLLDRGLPARDAVAGLALIALFNIGGTYLCGLLGGWWRRKYVLAGLYLARTAVIALFVLLPTSTASVRLFCAAMGLMWLGTLPLTNGLVAQVFGVRYLSTLFGFAFVGHQLGAFLGAWLGGEVVAATGSYEPIWWAAMLLGIAAAALHWPIDDRPLRGAAAMPELAR